jgi:hypothetical protein
MIVPDHWAEARRQHRSRNRQITVRRFGWSMHSADDAQTMADRRADEALQGLIAGQKLLRREPKMPYNGAEGVPIREEVLLREGEQVITRNGYGARCLNSPNALFADVDFDVEWSRASIALSALAVLATGLGVGFARGSVGWGLGALVLAAVLAAPVVRSLRSLWVQLHGGAEALVRKRLAKFLANRAVWNVRLYRTPAGLRLLATHQPFAAGDAEVQAFFDAVKVDPIYARMCRNQQCFRARLSAKPWRMGMASHMRPRPGVWPVAADKLPTRQAWVENYEARAAQFAACRYVESVGSGAVHLLLQPVVALHDQECRANDGALKLA